MKNLQKVFFTTIIVTSLFAANAFAACGGSSPNLIAANASRDEVMACFNIAKNGDTINIQPERQHGHPEYLRARSLLHFKVPEQAIL